MKNKALIITGIAFFLLINSVYFWEGRLGGFAIPATLFLLAVYLMLVFALVRQIFAAFKEKLTDKRRLFVCGFLLTIIILTSCKPSGLIDFERLEGKDLLIAQNEGAANCTTVLKLKDNFTFKERNICFGIEEIRGIFRVQHDTIFFENITPARKRDQYYKYAVIMSAKAGDNRPEGTLIRFADPADTTGKLLWITKNELDKMNTTGIGR